MAAKKITFPTKFYVGLKTETDFNFDDNTHHQYLLGFMTPDGNDKAAAKRKSTVDFWASQARIKRDAEGRYMSGPNGRNYVYEDVVPAIIVDNVPIAGFKLADMVRRYSTSNVVWRIDEPRGFQLEISSTNLAYLVNEAGILKGGIIDAECAWARIGNQNFLVPKNSLYWAEYEE